MAHKSFDKTRQCGYNREMLIAILSDTHNHAANLQTALEVCRGEGVYKVFHCGDMTTVETARLLEGFEVTYVYGNGDAASGAIRQTLLEMNLNSYGGPVYGGEIGQVSVAATHGHMEGVLPELVRSGKYDYVFCGHSHRRKEEQTGRTRVINPGALGGLRVMSPSFCLLDLDTGKARFVEL